VRVSAKKFFLAGGGRLVVSDEALILDSYRLAKYYSVSPEVFLNMPISEVRLHLRRTCELADLMRREQESDG
jgi:hypothetical protein